MKKLNKKGFTIVELVIVIAVIAILAGVLIPTFATVVDKANKSSANQTIAHAYEMACAEVAEKGKSIENATVVMVKGDKVYYVEYTNGKPGEVKEATKDSSLTVSNVVAAYAHAEATDFTALNLTNVTVTAKDGVTAKAAVVNTDIAAGVYVFEK